jgi:hypothetical protein
MTHALKRSLTLLTAMAVVAASFMTALPTHAAEDVEETSSINFSGQLIELSSTSVPTTIIVRENPEGEFKDYTVDVDALTAFGSTPWNTTSMDDWMPGDWLVIKGVFNENIEVVTANTITNQSMNPANYRGLNGWIDSIDESANQMVVQWNDVLHTVNITDNTHMVVPPENPAALTDFEVGDRVRLRLINDSDVENEARIILILRRGPRIYNLARTRGFHAELTELDTDSDTMNVTLLANDHLQDGDVNNLVGVEGDIVTVTWDDNTKFVRRFFGAASEDELTEGDNLLIVGRVNDDGTISARLVRDGSIQRFGVSGHVGEITEIDVSAETITILGLKNEGEWVINYDFETEFKNNGEVGTIDDLEIGDLVRTRGTANRELQTIEADVVSHRDAGSLDPHSARLTEILADIEEYEADEVVDIVE